MTSGDSRGLGAFFPVLCLHNFAGSIKQCDVLVNTAVTAYIIFGTATASAVTLYASSIPLNNQTISKKKITHLQKLTSSVSAGKDLSVFSVVRVYQNLHFQKGYTSNAPTHCLPACNSK